MLKKVHQHVARDAAGRPRRWARRALGCRRRGHVDDSGRVEVVRLGQQLAHRRRRDLPVPARLAVDAGRRRRASSRSTTTPSARAAASPRSRTAPSTSARATRRCRPTSSRPARAASRSRGPSRRRRSSTTCRASRTCSDERAGCSPKIYIGDITKLERPGDQEAQPGRQPPRPQDHARLSERQLRHVVQLHRLPLEREPGVEVEGRHRRRR